MTKLRELERRLKEEPENLGLRVMVAGALREAGRHDEAVELYRSVAMAYRDQGRSQQAIAVCRSILEIAPDDARCHALLATLIAGHKSATQPAPAPGLGRDVLEVGSPPERARPSTVPGALSPAEVQRARIGAALAGVPERISSYDETPLPAAVPYHVADPTARMALSQQAPPAGARPARPLTEDSGPTEVSGIANAARRISATLIAASRASDDDPEIELDTMPRARLERTDVGLGPLSPPAPAPRRAEPPPLDPDDELLTGLGPPEDDLPISAPPRRDSDDAQTFPNDLPRGVGRRMPLRAATPDVAPLPAPPAPAPPRTPALTAPLVPAAPRPPAAPSRPPAAPSRPPTAPAAAAPVAIPTESSGSAALAFSFFAPIPPERRRAVLARFSRRSIPAGAAVIRQGEQGHPLILVASGRLVVRVDRAAGAAGPPLELGAIGPGEHVGEATLLSRGPAPAHVVAANESDLLLLAPREFYEIVGAYPALWAQLKDVAERRAREYAAWLGR